MSSSPQRVVAIVGRPNVGKSALFNRLVGRRVAIVHEESGVTRDRLVCEAAWGDRRFDLIDTGGIGLMDGSVAHDTIVDGARRQVDIAIEDAAVIILVVDVTAGVQPLDTEVARLLHRSGRPVFIAANKADHDGRDAQAVDFEALGFQVYPLSAIHDRGLDPLMEAVVAKLPEAAEAAMATPLNVAVVGRPNVGKSSYVNRLLDCERVIVSEVAGTTRDSVEVPFVVGEGPQARHYLLIDTAGLRARGKTRAAVDTFSVMRTERSIERADVVVLMLDAVEGPSSLDKKIAAFILDAHKGCVLLVNKWDLARGVTQRGYEEALRRVLPFLGFVPVVFASAKTGDSIRRSVEVVDYVAAQLDLKLATGMLNRVLHEAFDRRQPPLVDGKRMKLYYATQVGNRPVRVRLFVNDPQRQTDAYRGYLVHVLRAAFGLEGAPVVLQFRSRPRTDRGAGS